VPQDYKFNGKEEQTELGLGWLDFGRRMHQPEIGRFFTQDRFAEKYYAMNPYQYGANNPIVFNDINGDSLWISFGNNNRVLYNNGQLQNADGSRYEGEGVKVTKKGNIRITDSFLRGTVSALNTIGSAEAGAGLIGELQSSDNNFTIKQGNFRFDPDNKLVLVVPSILIQVFLLQLTVLLIALQLALPMRCFMVQTQTRVNSIQEVFHSMECVVSNDRKSELLIFKMYCRSNWVAVIP
jgi:RHS repeat-associated protein